MPKSSFRRRAAGAERALVVGCGALGRHVAETLLADPRASITPVGLVDAGSGGDGAGAPVPIVGPAGSLPLLVREHGVRRVVLALPQQPNEESARVVTELMDLPVAIDVVPDGAPPPARARRLDGFLLVELRALGLSRRARLLKRSFDLVLAAAGIVVLAPVFAAIAAAIKLDSSGPVFFRQERVGSGGRRFRVLKFRTMSLDADELKPQFAHLNAHALNGGDPRLFKIAGDPRVTKVGRFLRSYFLDELPQLVNVLRGDMSLVGPRPLIPEEDRHVEAWARGRLDLRPGMTGLWQVLGHSAVSFGEMLKLDYLYVTTWSLVGDVKLLARTVPMVLRGGGSTY